jgi:CRP-like cAMP-binding protein
MEMKDKPYARTLIARAAWLAGHAPQLIDDLVEQGRLKRFEAGQWVHAEGDQGTGLLIVIDGAVQLYTQASGGREVMIGHAEAGAAIGQTMRFGGGPRIVTAICVQPSTLLLVSDTALDRIAQVRPDIWRAVASLAYAQLRLTVRMAAETMALPPRQRIASRLVALATPAARANRADIRIGQQALGELTGLTRKTVNSTLADFARLNLLDTGYGRITLTDIAGLQRVADS